MLILISRGSDSLHDRSRIGEEVHLLLIPTSEEKDLGDCGMTVGGSSFSEFAVLVIFCGPEGSSTRGPLSEVSGVQESWTQTAFPSDLFGLRPGLSLLPCGLWRSVYGVKANGPTTGFLEL